MSASENIFIGVIAGILTSAFLFIGAKLFNSVVLPWYRELIYKGIDLDGTWISELTNEANDLLLRHEISLRQSAHDIEGESVTTKKNPAESATVIQDIRGHTWEGYVVLTLMPKDRKRTSYGIAFLKVCNIGRSLEGYLVYRDGIGDNAVSMPVRFERSNGG